MDVKDNLFHYAADLVRIVDGDSVYLYLDMGFRCRQYANCRLFGINTPETRTSDPEEKQRGLAATKALEQKLAVSDELVARSVELDKYGRPLVTLFSREGVAWTNVNQWLLDEGHAVPYDGS